MEKIGKILNNKDKKEIITNINNFYLIQENNSSVLKHKKHK